MRLEAETATRRRVLRSAAAAAAATGVVTLAAAGCGSPSNQDVAPAGGTQPARIAMLFQSAGAPGEWDAITQAFTARYPHLTVDFNGIANADDFVQKGLAFAAGGTPPDFSGGNPRFHMAFFNAGALVDVNETIKRERLDVRDIPKNLMDDPAWKGKQLMMPAVFEPAVLFYNKTVFQAAGRPDPAALWDQKQWDWRRFAETVRALHPQGAPDELPYIAYHLQTWDGEFFSVVRSAGGDVLNPDRTKLVLDEPAGVDALEKGVELSPRSKVATPAVPLPQGGVHSGRVGVRYGVGSQVPGIRDAHKKAQATWTWDALPVPTDRKHTPALFVGGYSLWKGAKSAAQAVTLLKYLLTDEPMLIRAELGGRMPSRTKLLPEFGKRLDIPAQDPKNFLKAVEASLTNAVGLPHTPTFTTWRGILDDQVLLPAMQGKVAVRDALRAAKPAVEAELAKG
jgi:multiple sugar transport system substrate-binding protein